MKPKAGRQILFGTADSEAFEIFRADLKRLRTDWHCEWAPDAGTAMRMAVHASFDVVLAEERLPSGGGLQMLDEAWARDPLTLRFLHATAPTQELAARCIWKSHRLLTEPIAAAAVRDAILRADELKEWIVNEEALRLVGHLRTFPILPSIYFKLLHEIASPSATVKTVAALIEKDMAVSTKIVQVVNSPWYAAQHHISDLPEAVRVLGFDTLKGLVLAVHLMTEEDHVRPIYDLVREVWRHSLEVAGLARALALEIAPGDTTLADASYTAGLLHDLGKIILESNLNERYHGAIEIAQDRKLPLFEVEAFSFGANHATIAAHLAALWNLPARVVEAIALHHAPARAKDHALSPLAIVHIANVLEHEIAPGSDGLPLPPLDNELIHSLKLGNKLKAWRKRFVPRSGELQTAMPRSSAGESLFADRETSLPPHDGKADRREPQIETLAAPRTKTPNRSGRMLWMLAGLAAAAAIVFLLLPGREWAAKFFDGRNRSGASQPSPVDAAHTTTPPAATTIPEGKTPPGYKVSAIFLHPVRPSAMINGQAVFAGETVGNARVISIQTNSVRLRIGTEEFQLFQTP